MQPTNQLSVCFRIYTAYVMNKKQQGQNLFTKYFLLLLAKKNIVMTSLNKFMETYQVYQN